MKKNVFINAALEELNAEESKVEKQIGVTDASVVETTDAVAQLQEQHDELKTENAGLEAEVFDNDVTQIETNAESVSDDLEEVVQAAAALEELSCLADLAVKKGQVNKATVATLAFGLEQITNRLGMPSVIAALEGDTVDVLESQQASTIGEKAKDKSKELFERLVAGIAKVIGWVVALFRKLSAPFLDLSARAKKAEALVGSIDESKEITNEVFINSLKLVAQHGDPSKQFADFEKIVPYALRWVFSDSSINALNHTFHEFVLHNGQPDVPKIKQHLDGLTDYASRNIFKTINRAEQPTTGALIGGIGYTLVIKESEDSNGITSKAVSVVINRDVETESPKSIPVVEKKLATTFLQNAQVLLDFKPYESSLKKLEDLAKKTKDVNFDDIPLQNSTRAALQYYISVINSLGLSLIPALARHNLFVVSSFIKYVEESAKASK